MNAIARYTNSNRLYVTAIDEVEITDEDDTLAECGYVDGEVKEDEELIAPLDARLAVSGYRRVTDWDMSGGIAGWTATVEEI